MMSRPDQIPRRVDRIPLPPISVARIPYTMTSVMPPSSERTYESNRPRRLFRVLVGVQDEGMNGIETYAEQVAVAAHAAGHDTTLLVTTAEVAAAVRARHDATEFRVVDLGLGRLSRPRQALARLAPALQTRRVGGALRAAIRGGLTGYDVLHLNRPALAPHAAGAAARTYCAGWFHPHSPSRRVIETWRHTRGSVPRRLVLAGKALSFYFADERGYRCVDGVVVFTALLAEQLRRQGRPTFICPPPVTVPPDLTEPPAVEHVAPGTTLRLLVCSGDLSHPRKNLREAIRAMEVLARHGMRVELRAIGRNPEALEAAARELPQNAGLTVLGPLGPSEVRTEMRLADVLLLPSLYEEWGYVAVESILAGTPVATFPVYPFDEMLAGGLGVVAQSMSAESLAAASRQAATGARGQSLALAGARRFGSAVVGERLTAIWCGGHAPGSTRRAQVDSAETHEREPERLAIGATALSGERIA